jgi:hypothetical protein
LGDGPILPLGKFKYIWSNIFRFHPFKPRIMPKRNLMTIAKSMVVAP